MNARIFSLPALLLALMGAALSPALNAPAADSLERGFARPPAPTKPWVYWYWISDNISKEGLTRDLAAMQRAGIGEAFIGNIFLDDVRKGSVKALSEEWWGMVEHAIREGGRIGVDIGMFNCPGWSQSGGPWIQPTQAMRFLVSSETRVQGPAHFEKQLPVPRETFQDVAVLAFPAPGNNADSLARRSPQITCTPTAPGVEKLVDAQLNTAFTFPSGAGQGKNAFTMEIALTEPMAARSLSLTPADSAWSAQGELQAAGDDGQFRAVKSFKFDRSNMAVGVGPMPRGAVTISFPATTAKRFRVAFKNVSGRAELAELNLSAAARVESFVEKQLGKMHPTPLPMWDTYLWPAQPEPDSTSLAIAPREVVNLAGKLGTDGVLRWEVPAGDWIIVRTGMTPTGTRNAPASPEGQGLEVDKMNRAAAQAHFDAYLGKLLARMPAKDRKAFKHVIADSYEMGSQNWTDGFDALFRQRHGYDPLPWLPVLTGRVVGSADQSDRFLWDLRRLVADRVASDYVGGLRDAAHRHGLKLWLENYGHWGFPGEFLQYGGQSDQVGGEFWATGDLGSIELRAASSCAHTYGKPIVSAEAFTSVLKFESTPWSLKLRGDWALTEGINHWVLHVYIHQPDERRPGVNAWFSTEFNRHNTWFEAGRAFFDYYRRADFLLQQGRHVADVAYFIGEDAPKMTGVRQPALPPGHDFDYINAEVIEQRLKVKKGRFVLPDGMSYRVLVLPELATMRPEVLKKISALVAAGGTVLGSPPLRSPSLQGFPACDAEVTKLAAALWRNCDGQTTKRVKFGKGQVFRGVDLPTVFNALNITPDFAGADAKRILWTHRATDDADLFFLSNQSEQPATVVPTFRVHGRAPELWDAVSGRITKTAAFAAADGGVRVPIELEPRGSVFVVFRESAARIPTVARVTKNGEEILSTAARSASSTTARSNRDAANTFTMAGWVKPDGEIALPKEANSGVAIHLARNEVVVPVHGGTVFPDGGHSCAGISAGRNGVVIYEHAGNYFAPLLVCAAPLTDWTHVAVVYQDGQPSLFLDGKLVRQGLKSTFQVHSGISAGGGRGSFKGERSEFEDFDHALPASEVVALAKSKPPVAAETSLPVIRVTRDGKNAVVAEVAAPATYEFTLSDGKTKAVTVPSLPSPQSISGPWTLSFPPDMDVPGQVTLERLASLTEHPNEAIKHFSGTTTYRTMFDLTVPRGNSGTPTPIYLDLGRVESMAEVILNGRNLGVLWKPPFVLEITGLTQPGSNTLEVRVTDTWRNRLIGDAKYPQGFPTPGDAAQGSSAARFKPTLAVNISVSANEKPLPSGLLGPVRLLSTARVTVSAH